MPLPSRGLARELGELLIGHDPRHPVPLWRRLMTAVSGTGSSSASGIAYNAISGIETALWDLLARSSANRPSACSAARIEIASRSMPTSTAGRSSTASTRLCVTAGHSGQPRIRLTHVEGFYWEDAEAEGISIEATVARCREAVADGYRNIKLDLDVFSTVREGTSRSATTADLGECGTWPSRCGLRSGTTSRSHSIVTGASTS